MYITDSQNSPLKNISDINGQLAYRGSVISGSAGTGSSNLPVNSTGYLYNDGNGNLSWSNQGQNKEKSILFNSNQNGNLNFSYYSGICDQNGVYTVSCQILGFDNSTAKYPTFLRVGNCNLMLRTNNVAGTRLPEFYSVFSGTYFKCSTNQSLNYIDKKWHSLTVTSNASQTGLKIYFDNNIIASGSTNQGSASAEIDPILYIGNDVSNTCGPRSFIKNIKIWNTFELSESQIYLLHNGIVSIPPTFSVSITGDWPMCPQNNSGANSLNFGTTVFLQ